MRTPEWSLILFTLLTQLAIGTFVVIQAMNIFYLSKSSSFAAKEIVLKILLSIFVVLILAIVTSFLHLGKPKNAAFAASHFFRSWLSREIVFLILFTFFAGISYVLQLDSSASHTPLELLITITSLIGFITILAMAKVYMLETVPVWNSYSTPIQFITTSLLLGGVSSILFFAVYDKGFNIGGPLGEIIKTLLPLLLFLLIVGLITFLIHLNILRNADIAALDSYKLLTDNHLVLLVLRLSSLIVSIILCCVLLFTGTKTITPYLWVFLCSAVFLSEVIGRYLFYASYSRVGV